MTDLVDIQFLRASRCVETERILYLVDNGDLLWVFDVSSGNVNRDLRFWSREATAKEKCPRFSLQQVVDLILGQKKNFRSTEIERQWILSAQTMMRLRRAGEALQPVLHMRQKHPALWRGLHAIIAPVKNFMAELTL